MKVKELQELFHENKVIVPDNLKLGTLPRITRPDKAIRAVNFIQTLCSHTKGRWAGAQFLLFSWQFKLIWQLYGQCKPDGTRQYRICYVEIPKKNGKSELAAAVALIGLVGDDEQGAEVYSAAADRAQAGLVYNVAAPMVRKNITLKKRLKIVDSRNRIIDFQTNSFYQVLSSEVFTKHGLNPSTVIFDELHAQPNRDLWDVLVEGTDYARLQQIVFAITTAGVYDKTSICWEVRELARQVMEGIIKDDSMLPVIYAADKDKDDWEDPKVWARVNPSLGHIFDMGKIKKDYEAVKQQPSRLNNFLRFRLNMWVNQITRWMPMDAWDKCDGKVDKGKLLKRTCYGALDLSSTTDLTVFALCFPPEKKKEKCQILVKFYIPEESMVRRSKEDRVPYDMWVRAGLIIATPGNVVDYAFIRRDISGHYEEDGVIKTDQNCAANLYDLQEIAYDPWGAVKFAQELQDDDGIPMVEHRQGYKSMSPPTKELLKMTLAGELAHGGNPVLRWCMDNMVVQIDAAENVKPAKDKARERIDGAVAVIMALSRTFMHDPASVYEERGVLSF